VALRKLKRWLSANLLGRVRVDTLDREYQPVPMVDITVEPSHEFLVKSGNSWLRTHNCIIDDPHTEAEALAAILNPGIYDKTYEWFSTGPRQRLQPQGAIIICMTRWSQRDLCAQVLETAAKNKGADQWEVFEFPAILPSGKPLWPNFWELKELLAIKAEIPTSKWQAQYMQDPTSDENAIIKRQDWRIWEAERPPPVEYIIMAMDTAFEARKSADYSAAVFFGVWNNDDDGGQPNLILLNAWRDKLEFPELKAKTLEMYKEWEPDSIIIEKRASGAPLIYELRRMGIPVGEFTPSRGNDKITRLNAIADIFASGKVWRPDTRWAEEVVDEMAAFPNARNDDYTDCVSLALARYRQGGFIGTQHDEEDVDFSLYRARKAQYY
jgi:predicted phage terminase large subunit-like protein